MMMRIRSIPSPWTFLHQGGRHNSFNVRAGLGVGARTLVEWEI